MTARKTKAATAKVTTQEPVDDLLERVTTTAALVQDALVNAAKASVPMTVSVGAIGVLTSWNADVMHARVEGPGLVGPTMFAIQAGVLLGAARAAKEMEDNSDLPY